MVIQNPAEYAFACIDWCRQADEVLRLTKLQQYNDAHFAIAARNKLEHGIRAFEAKHALPHANIREIAARMPG